MVGVEDLAAGKSRSEWFKMQSPFFDLHNVKIINQCENIEVTVDSLLTQIFYNLG